MDGGRGIEASLLVIGLRSGLRVDRGPGWVVMTSQSGVVLRVG